MPYQVLDRSIPVIISGELCNKVNEKIRVAGSLVCYDTNTLLALVQDRSYAVLVDMTLCVDPSQNDQWAKQMKGNVMITGHLESVIESLDIPPLPVYSDMPEVDPYLVIRAIIVRTAETLNLNKWRSGINALDTHIGTSASSLASP